MLMITDDENSLRNDCFKDKAGSIFLLSVKPNTDIDISSVS